MSKDTLFQVSGKIIQKIEALEIPPLVLALYFTSLISLREVFEQVFFERSHSRYQFMHHFFFACFVLLAGILIISFLSRTAIARTTLIVASGFSLFVLPPLVDRWIFLRRVPYDYILPKEFLKNILTFFLFTPKAGIGTIIEIYSMLLLASFYVWTKTRSWRRTVLTGISLYVLVSLAATPRLFFRLPRLTDARFWQSRHIVYIMIYFSLALIASVCFLCRINRALPKAVLRELLSPRTLHFVFMVGAGTYFNRFLHFFSFPDFLYILLSMILLVILWLGTVLINNVYDLEIDKISNPRRPLPGGQISPSFYLGLSPVLFLVSLLISSLLGFVPFLLTLVIILSSLGYSVPPLRLRNNLWGTLFIGWGSCLAFFIGYFNRVLIRDISIDKNIVILAGIIFAALSLGPLTKDLKDYQGDNGNGVKSFFTVYGLQKGKKIVSILLGLSLSLPLILFHRPADVIFLSLVSAIVALLFYRRGKLYISYAGYGSTLAYCLFRLVA
jgi:4-hydroxybenzoate polyprenyltransferase